MSPLLYIVGIGCIVVLLILAMGIGQMGRGGIEGAKRSNRLMKWRIIAQFGVVMLVVLLVALRGTGG
ncbi:twin transmembrane helix small protein [Celeribacter arenosi]|uniref:HIG1 domain-containing protein n=1 Tax=Celeribacter arenosi TaxID=792649 RepID=A0ABP7K1Z4_9RHOB